jgi:UDP:flavonoid glycosyltransferase YjiC (YdhE family)
MFSGDISIIPSSPSLDPLRENDNTSFHVGMISNWRPSSDHIDLIESSSATDRVFSYVGEASRPRFGYEEMLSEIVASERAIGFYIVGDPNRYTTSQVQERLRAGDVKLDHFLPAPPMIEDSSVVLCPGSGGTTLLSLSLGKPIVCIGAYHSDCSTRFARVEEQGAGIMLKHSDDPLERRPAPELGDGVEMLGHWQTNLTSDVIRDAIHRSIDDPLYKENARRLGREILSLGGTSAAIDICERELIR